MPEKNRLRRSKIGFTNPDITWMKAEARRDPRDLRFAGAREPRPVRPAATCHRVGRVPRGPARRRPHLLACARHRTVDAPVHRSGGGSVSRATRAGGEQRARPSGPARRPGAETMTSRGYERIPVKTHLIHIKEPLEPVFDEYVKPVLQPGDWLAVSEKFVTISQGRVIHHSVVRPGLAGQAAGEGRDEAPRRRRLLRSAQDAGRDHAGRLVPHVLRDDRRRLHTCRVSSARRLLPHRRAPHLGDRRLQPRDREAVRRVRDAWRPPTPTALPRRLVAARGRTGCDCRRQQHQRRGAGHEPGLSCRPSAWSARYCSTTRSARTTS